MARREIDEQLLFDAALNEFTQYSFKEASVNRIITNAKIAKGSFYYRFSNKYELYIHLLKEANHKKWQFIKAETEIKPDSNSDIFDLFLMQAETGVRFALKHPELFNLGKMFSKEKGSLIYEKVLQDLVASGESDLSQLIKSSYDSGIFKSAYSLEFVDKVMNFLLLSYNDILFRDEEYDLDRAMFFLKDFVNFLKYGLKE